MTELEKLDDEFLRERGIFDKQKVQERDDLLKKQAAEISRLGASPELDRKHEKEIIDLQQEQAQKGQQLIDRQEKKYQAELFTRQQKSKLENDEIERERTALNIKRADDRELRKEQEKADDISRENFIERMKRQWSKNPEKDKDR